MLLTLAKLSCSTVEGPVPPTYASRSTTTRRKSVVCFLAEKVQNSWLRIPEIPALGRYRQGYQEFQVILIYMVSLRPSATLLLLIPCKRWRIHSAFASQQQNNAIYTQQGKKVPKSKYRFTAKMHSCCWLGPFNLANQPES